MPLEVLDNAHAPQFISRTVDPAKSVRLAFGAVSIMKRLGLTDEETVEQIWEEAYMQSFWDLSAIPESTVDPSMIV